MPPGCQRQVPEVTATARLLVNPLKFESARFRNTGDRVGGTRCSRPKTSATGVATTSWIQQARRSAHSKRSSPQPTSQRFSRTTACVMNRVLRVNVDWDGGDRARVGPRPGDLVDRARHRWIRRARALVAVRHRLRAIRGYRSRWCVPAWAALVRSQPLRFGPPAKRAERGGKRIPQQTLRPAIITAALEAASHRAICRKSAACRSAHRCHERAGVTRCSLASGSRSVQPPRPFVAAQRATSNVCSCCRPGAIDESGSSCSVGGQPGTGIRRAFEASGGQRPPVACPPGARVLDLY